MKTYYRFIPNDLHDEELEKAQRNPCVTCEAIAEDGSFQRLTLLWHTTTKMADAEAIVALLEGRHVVRKGDNSTYRNRRDK